MNGIERIARERGRRLTMADLSAEGLAYLKSLAGHGLADVLVREIVSVHVPRLVAEVERRRASASPGAETAPAAAPHNPQSNRSTNNEE